MNKKLYVGNLPYSVTDVELRELFAQAGGVTDAAVIMDRETGRSKGFGFVEMSTDEEATKAISQFNGHTLANRQIQVSEARPREERGPRSGGGGGGGYGGDRGDRGGGGYGGDRDSYGGGGGGRRDRF
jgi:cold-inducible RNA-binding protein